MGRHLASLLIVALSMSLIAGCSLQQDSSDTGNLTGSIVGGETGTNLAPTAELDSVKLYIYIANPSFQTVRVYRALSPWAESTITYSSFGDNYDSVSYGSFIASSVGWHSVDITFLANSWINDSFPNYGLVLDQDVSVFPQTIYLARESQFKPYLDISFGSTFSIVQDMVVADADAFVDGSNPDRSDGTSLALMTGWADNSGSEHKALLHFELPTVQPELAFGSVSGNVWFDSDANGLHDVAENSLSGVVVTLRTCDTVFLSVTETDVNGDYGFDSLAPGDYRVFVDLPAGYEITQNDVGLDDAIDSDFDTLFAHTICYTLDGISDATNVDCGFIEIVEVDEGCTHGHSYFKNRCWIGPKDDIVSVLLPIQLGIGEKAFTIDSARTAYFFLKLGGSGDPWNGIYKLSRQLLTTRLNLKLGADPSVISTQLVEIDAFLGTHDRSDWIGLKKEEKQLVRSWKELLQAYNTGEIGPGSCDEEESDEHHDEYDNDDDDHHDKKHKDGDDHGDDEEDDENND